MDNTSPGMTYEAHPRGNTGARKSVLKTVQAAAAGRLSQGVTVWAQRKLVESGAVSGSKSEQAQTLLYALRREKFYIPDPVDAEKIAVPDCLLADCNGLTLEGGDCDDLSAALAAACESVGVVCAIVGQAFDDGQHFQHVLVACETEDGQWYYADPSEAVAFGSPAREPTREVWLLVPSGRLLCDKAPSCIIDMQGVGSQATDRAMGDGVYIGFPAGDVGDVGDPGSSIAPKSSSAGWSLVKGILTIGVVALAGYGACKLIQEI